MLKRVDTAELEIGMFIHKMEGSWLSHPFWRAHFLLRDLDKLELLRSSGLDGVIIDTEKGADVRQSAAPLEMHEQIVKPTAPVADKIRRFASATVAPRLIQRGNRSAADADLRLVAPLLMRHEFGRATRVADRAHTCVARAFYEIRLGKAVEAARYGPVIEDIFASVQRNPHAFIGLLRCKRESEYAYRHALAVCALMISIGLQMKLPADRLREAGMAGLLNDIGIWHLPVDLSAVKGDYRKLGPTVLHDHVRLGHELLVMGGIAESVAQACLEHHEQMDGAGYPAGLQGASISLFGRMVAICDKYDELVNDDDGALGLNPATAIQQMGEMTGALDSTILVHLVEAMGIYPVGSVVLLRSGRLAMVVDQGPSGVALPKVRAFYSTTTGRPITPVDISLWECFGQDAIENAANPETYSISDFPRLREKLFAAACAA